MSGHFCRGPRERVRSFYRTPSDRCAFRRVAKRPIDRLGYTLAPLLPNCRRIVRSTKPGSTFFCIRSIDDTSFLQSSFFSQVFPRRLSRFRLFLSGQAASSSVLSRSFAPVPLFGFYPLPSSTSTFCSFFSSALFLGHRGRGLVTTKIEFL